MLDDLQRWWVTGRGQNCTELGTDSRRAFLILMERRSQFYGMALWVGKAKEKRASRDGACLRNPGPGGWAYILRFGEHVAERGGGVPASTTNNRMEIQAAIEGLKPLKEPCRVLLVTDSTYLLNGINIYRHAWRENGWVIRRKNNKPVPNADLWKLLDELVEQHTVECKWVRGHSGSPDNERCDELATLYATGRAAA